MAKKLSFSIAVNLLIEQFQKNSKSLKNSFKSIQMQAITFAAALGAGGVGLLEMITRFKDVARETSRVNTMLKNVSGSTQQFGKNLEFINSMAAKYGLEVNALTSNFAKFTATASLANVSMEEQEKIFESMSRASTAFGLSADDTNAVFLALSQMMSKGKISSEELRGQMGERLPIAMQAMAKAAGVSMAGLEDLMKQGKLMSADVIPKFADALNEMIPEVNTDNLETSLNRLQNTFTKIVDSSGFQSSYKALIDGLNEIIATAGDNVKSIITVVIAGVGFVITNALSNVWKGWSSTATKLTSEAPKLNAALTAATAQRVAAEKALETSRIKHSVAVGNARLKYEKQIAAKQILLSQSIAAEDKARAAVQAAAATQGASASTRAFNTIKVGAAKLMVSLKGLWASFAPGLIISGLIAIGSALKGLYDKTTRLKRATDEYEASVESERISINILFARLKDAKKGTEDYNKAKNDILSKYGSYLKGMSDEIKSLEDVEGAYKAISAAAIQAAKDRAISSTTEEASSDYINTYKKQASALKKSLEKELGKEQGNILFDSIVKQLSESGKLDDETSKIVDSLGKTITTSYGTAGSSSSVRVNNSASAIDEIARARQRLDSEIAEIESIFGKASSATTDGLESGGTTTTPTLDPTGGDAGKKLIEGSIAWYKAKIKELEETIEDSTSVESIGKMQADIEKYNKAIEDLDGTTAEKQRKAAEDLRKAKEEQIRSTYETYKSYLQAQADLDAQYAKDRSLIVDSEGNVQKGFTQENVVQLEAEKQIADEALAIQFAEKQTEFENFIDAIKNKTLEDLEIALATAQSELEAMQGVGLADSNTLSLAKGKVYALQDAVRETNPEVAGELEPEESTIEKWAALEEQLRAVADEFEEMGDAIGGSAGEALKFVGSIATDTISMMNSITQFGKLSMQATQTTAATTSTAVKTVEKASVILAIISVAIQIAMKIAELFNSNAKALEEHEARQAELTEQKANQQRVYNNLLREEAQLQAERGTVFGGDDYGAALTSLDVYKGAQSELQKELQGSLDNYNALVAAAAHTEKLFGKGNVISTSMMQDAQKELDNYEAGLQGLGDIEIVVGSKTVKTGFLNLKKEQQDVYGSLLDYYPDLIDAEGKLNTQLAQSIIDTKTLSDSDKERLQNMIALQEEADAALEAVNSYWEGIFGELGSSLTSALVDAYKNGTDAGEAFAESMAAMLETLAADFAHSMAIAPILADAQKKVEEINNSNLTAEQRAKAMQDLMIQTGKEMAGAQEEYYAYLDAMKAGAAEAGVDIFTADAVEQTQESSTGGFESMSQDTADELNGRFAALQMSGVRMETMLGDISVTSSSLLSIQNAAHGELHAQTLLLSEMRTIQLNTFYEVEASKKLLTTMGETLTNIDKNTAKI